MQTQTTIKTVDQHLKEMLKENTGSHFLDSGGAYGRHWERNQGRDFENEPRVMVDLDVPVVNVYHYLNEVLGVDEFTEYVNQLIDYDGVHWAQEALVSVRDRDLVHKATSVKNTYNEEENLSQVLQVACFSRSDEMGIPAVYVLLQIHQGCDVRGGYTQARCFRLEGILTGLVDIIGEVDGYPVSTLYDGIRLRWDDDKSGSVSDNSEVDLEDYRDEDICLDFHLIEVSDWEILEITGLS